MYRVELQRYGCTDKGTFGKLTVHEIIGVVAESREVFSAYTVECPWLDNKPFKSCIPSGDYTLQPFSSERYGETFCIVGGTVYKYKKEVDRVHYGSSDYDRFACLIHASNLPRNVQGCIGLGTKQGYMDDQWAVSHSKDAVSEFLALMYECGDNIPFAIKPPESF